MQSKRDSVLRGQAERRQSRFEVLLQKARQGRDQAKEVDEKMRAELETSWAETCGMKKKVAAFKKAILARDRKVAKLEDERDAAVASVAELALECGELEGDLDEATKLLLATRSQLGWTVAPSKTLARDTTPSFVKVSSSLASTDSHCPQNLDASPPAANCAKRVSWSNSLTKDSIVVPKIRIWMIRKMSDHSNTRPPA